MVTDEEETTTVVVLEAVVAATLQGSLIARLHQRTDQCPVPAADLLLGLCSLHGEGEVTTRRDQVMAVVVVVGISTREVVWSQVTSTHHVMGAGVDPVVESMCPENPSPLLRITTERHVIQGRMSEAVHTHQSTIKVATRRTMWCTVSTATVPVTRVAAITVLHREPTRGGRGIRSCQRRSIANLRITLMRVCVTGHHIAGHLTAAPRPGSRLKARRRKSGTRSGQ